ncbi:MAG TPA: four helix bundle protein [Verrucomicrobiae bacterium]
MKFRFEKLEVWQEARKINLSVYRLTERFPRSELFAMTSQLRRASISISANIAEGSGRNSDKDFAHFLEQAYGSLMEVASIFYLALDKNYVKANEIESFFDELEILAKRIAALNRSLSVLTSKTPFARDKKSSALDPRPSAFA